MAAEVDLVHMEQFLILRNAIIERAIEDYKTCTLGYKRRDTQGTQEVELFFGSIWCAMLLNTSTVTGPEILETLHEWRDKAKRGRGYRSPQMRRK